MAASLPQLAAADQKDGRADQSHASTGEGSGVGPVYQVLGTEIYQLWIDTGEGYGVSPVYQVLGTEIYQLLIET
jgi:hypothetical protein